MCALSDNHGSASLWRHDTWRIAQFITPKNGIRGFMLGTNRPYAGNVSVLLETGERYALPDGTRIDTPDFGTGWDPTTLKGMACTFGSGRSGKGAGLIIPALLTYSGNIVCNDPKGQNAWITATRRRAMGHKVAICDPFGEVNRAYGSKVNATETVMRYNPLARLDASALSFSEDISGISEAITIVQAGGDSHSFFAGSARDMIEGVIAGVVVSSPPGRATFRTVREIISLDDTSFSEWVGSVCSRYPQSLAYRKLGDFIEMNRTNQGVKKTAKEQTKFLDSELLLRYMEPSPGEATFDFAELATAKLDVFLVLPATLLITQSRWLRLMINQALRAVLHARAAQDTPVLFELDEAGTSLGHLDEIENAYGLTSGMGVLCWSFYQDLSQIQRDYPKSWQTFIGNSACLHLLEAKDAATSEFFSQYIGHKTVRTYSSGTSASSSSGAGAAAMGRGSNASYSESFNTGETGRPVMTPDEIRRMPPEEMLVIFPKRGNFRQFKIEYYKDARFNNLYRMDPNEQTAYPPPWKYTPSVIRKAGAAPGPKKKAGFVDPVGIIRGVAWAAFLLSLFSMFKSCARDNSTALGNHVEFAGFMFLVACLTGFMKKKQEPVQSADFWIDGNGILQYSVPPPGI